MKITLEPTGAIETINGNVPARVWAGFTESGVPVKAWIATISPQTHDQAMLAEFDRELHYQPDAKREPVAYDMRLFMP